LAEAAVLPPLPEFKGRPGWEFTDLTGLDLDSFEPAPPASQGARPLFEDAPVPEGIEVFPLDEAPAELRERLLGSVVSPDDPFVARNEARRTGGVLVRVPRGTQVDGPLVLSAVVDGAAALNWRTIILVEEGADAEVWEQYLSTDADSKGLLNTVVEIVVEQNARLRFLSAQQLNEKSLVFGTQRASVARDGTLEWASIGFGSSSGKVRMETTLDGPGAHAKVTGAYAGLGRQHLDYDTTQEHAAPNTTSDLAFRGLLQGRSSSVWRGMIKVDPGAQQTDAFQESRNLLLSKKAHADAIPGLEIEANDVRCTHAAAIAQIDADQLFYLSARGLPKPTAMRLVIEGFMQELVERFQEGPAREVVAGALERRLDELLPA